MGCFVFCFCRDGVGFVGRGGGGWFFWGAEGLGLRVEGLGLIGWGFGGFVFCFCCNGLGFVRYGGGWVVLGC